MAVTSVYRKPGTRTGTRTREGYDHSDVWIVETDDHNDNQDVILAEFVAPGGTYGGRIVESISCSEVSEDGRQWEVTVNFANSAITNPLTAPVKLGMTQSPVQVPTDFDKNGNPILNAAGDPFQEAVFLDDIEDTLQFTKNYALIPYAAAQSAKRKIGTITGVPGYGLYKGMSAQEQEHETIGIYYTCTIEFSMADSAAAFAKKLLNQGYREKVGGQLKVIKINGEVASQPVLLAANGTKLAPGATPTEITVDLYNVVNFSTIFGI
jgi:hypothetical protein